MTQSSNEEVNKYAVRYLRRLADQIDDGQIDVSNFTYTTELAVMATMTHGILHIDFWSLKLNLPEPE